MAKRHLVEKIRDTAGLRARELDELECSDAECFFGELPPELLMRVIEETDWGSVCALSLASCSMYALVKSVLRPMVQCMDREVPLLRWRGAYYLELKHYETYPTAEPLHFNYSQCRKTGVNRPVASTVYCKVRIDPDTLLVHTGDATFARSGPYGWAQSCGANENFMTYARTYACDRRHSKAGRANVDLRGTPFAIKSDFHHSGCASAGEWAFSNKRQVLELKGGGHCGWACSELADANGEGAMKEGGWHLQLQWADE
eukprot:TRINITY_DN23618_c0_g1_i1.p1 TRINITY_DN23618_c0_g1~~TRINITY_DN23618_c0_g1_i1.p1  ORF type:complete len:258 (-),score=65.65 TRINITY_DN23618_c0_g1_i1:260-1033(-)